MNKIENIIFILLVVVAIMYILYWIMFFNCESQNGFTCSEDQTYIVSAEHGTFCLDFKQR